MNKSDMKKIVDFYNKDGSVVYYYLKNDDFRGEKLKFV